MLDEIARLREILVAERSGLGDDTALEAFRLRYLGRKGLLPALFQQLSAAPPDERPALGKAIHALKGEVEAAVESARSALAAAAETALPPGFDPSLPPRLPWVGAGTSWPPGSTRSSASSGAWASAWPRAPRSSSTPTTSRR